MARDNVFINEICTWGFTEEGKNLCKHIGMNYICDHKKDNGQIFSIKFKNLLDHPMCDDFVKLKETYEKYNYKKMF